MVTRLPHLIEALNRVRARNASAGAGLSTVVTDGGEVYAFGQYDDGITYVPSIVEFPDNVSIKMTVAANHMYCSTHRCIALTEAGRVFAWTKTEGPSEINFPFGGCVRLVHSCASFFGAVMTNGDLFVWGIVIDPPRKLKNPTKVECFDGMDVVAISLSLKGSIVRTRDGAVFGMVAAIGEDKRFEFQRVLLYA